MAVYKRTYKAYAGRLTPQRNRFWVVSRYALTELFESRIFIAALIACFFPVLLSIIVIYLNNNEAIRTLLEMQKRPLTMDRVRFLEYMEVQGTIAWLLASWAGPRLVSVDLANNALPLFLSHPISRTEYVLGKFVVIFSLASAVSWVPGMLLFALQVQLGPAGWFSEYWSILPGMVAGGVIWCSVLALVALAISSWVKWRILGTGAMIAVFLLPAGISEAFNDALHTHWGSILNVLVDMHMIWRQLLGMPVGVYHRAQFRELPPQFSWYMIAGLCLLAVYILDRRLRAKEIVRG